MNFTKIDFFMGVGLNNYRMNVFLARLRANISYIGIAGIAGLVLAGGGYTWISNLSDRDAYYGDSILNLDVILAMDEDEGAKVFGPQVPYDSLSEQAETDLSAAEKTVDDQSITYRLPTGLPTPVEKLPLVANARTYPVITQQQNLVEQVSGDLESEEIRLKPAYAVGSTEAVIVNTTDLTTDLVIPVPAVLSPDARNNRQVPIQQRAKVNVSNPQVAIASGLLSNAGGPVPKLPVGPKAQSTAQSQGKTIEQVLADPIHAANNLLQNWQQLRAQTAHEFAKLPWSR